MLERPSECSFLQQLCAPRLAFEGFGDQTDVICSVSVFFALGIVVIIARRNRYQFLAIGLLGREETRAGACSFPLGGFEHA